MKGRIPVDQCKRSAESRTFQRLPPFERGEIKALSGEGLGVSAFAARIGGDKAAAGCGIKRGTARQPDGGSAERPGHFAETGGAAHGKSRKNCRKPLKIGECPGFLNSAGEMLGVGRPPDAAAGARSWSRSFRGSPPFAPRCHATILLFI
jgi:hypothetical protein